MSELKNKIEKAKEGVAKEVWQESVEKFNEEKTGNLLVRLGKIGLANNLSTALQSQTIKEIQAIRDEKEYKYLRFNRFEDFLDGYIHSPMGYKKFNRLENLMKTEGDVLFDTFNALQVSHPVRKLLAAGEYEAISVEGDQIKIGEETADLSNTRFVRSLIEAYAEDCKRLSEENKKQADRLEKGKEDYEKQKQRLIEAENSTPSAENSISNPLTKANALVLGSLSALADELDNSTIVDAQAYSENSLRLLATQFTRVQEILCRKLGIELADLSMISSDEADRVADLLDDDEF